MPPAEVDTRRIILEAVYDIRCVTCKYRSRFRLRFPVDPIFFFEDHDLVERFMTQKFSPTEVKHWAARTKCPECWAHDFEIGLGERLDPYRDGDELRLPVTR